MDLPRSETRRPARRPQGARDRPPVEGDKPGSVPDPKVRGVIYLGHRSPGGSCGPPGARCGGSPLAPARPCSRWGLSCRGRYRRARWALTPPFHPCLCGGRSTGPERAAIGGLFSVTLSVASRRPGFPRHRTLWSPDFPRAAPHVAADPRPRLPPTTSTTHGPRGFHGDATALPRARGHAECGDRGPTFRSVAPRCSLKATFSGDAARE